MVTGDLVKYINERRWIVYNQHLKICLLFQSYLALNGSLIDFIKRYLVQYLK
jgi:hypothetical protein